MGCLCSRNIWPKECVPRSSVSAAPGETSKRIRFHEASRPTRRSPTRIWAVAAPTMGAATLVSSS
eukprot:scaffold52888_cov70-Phaeocystis_antarctica.AAC.28